MKIDIPDAQSGDWRVNTVEVPKPDPSTMVRAMLRGGGRYVPAGTYKQLLYKKEIVMSNTPDEIKDFYYFVREAYGSVLVNGLGLGVLLKALLAKEDIIKVTVIENSEDVINLISASINDRRVVIIHADAFEYVPPKGEKYDFVWHDIWNTICADNVSEMIKLHRKYGKRAKHQESWCREICERQRKEDRYLY